MGLTEITPADAERWRRWLLAREARPATETTPAEVMAIATVSRFVKRAKAMFAEAVAGLLLAEAFELASDGAEYCVGRYRAGANLGTEFKRIVERAGVAAWPKPLINLRSTRRTELLAHYPAKDVTSWLGNSPDVANKHYAMTMQASFDRAVVDGAKIIGVTTTPPPAAETAPEKTPRNPPPTVQANGGNPETQKKPIEENPVNDWVCLQSALAALPLSYPARNRTIGHNTGIERSRARCSPTGSPIVAHHR